MEKSLEDYSDNSATIYGNKSWLGIKGTREFFAMWLEDLIPAR